MIVMDPIDEATDAVRSDHGGAGTDLQAEAVFDKSASLQLLQLEARRSIAERRLRRASASAQDAADETSGVLDRLSAGGLQVPERWRLVPETVSLYAWQQECLPLWLREGRGTVKVATGGGKTLFALAAAQALQNESEPDLRLAIVVPTIPLMFQWRDELVKGNLPASAIGLMGGSQDLPPLEGLGVLVCVLNSARERLAGMVRKAQWPSRMLLVVDECHRSAAAQARQIFDAGARYTLGLSATPESELDVDDVPSDEAYNKSVVGQALGPIIYEFSLKQSLEAGLLTPFEVWHIGLPLNASEATEHGRLSDEISELRKPLQLRHARSGSRQPFLAWCQTQASRGGLVQGDAERFIGLSNRRKRLLYRAVARQEVALAILADAMRAEDSRAILFHEAIEEIERMFLTALERNLPAVLEHSQLPDSLRSDSIEAFRQGTARVIVSAKSLVEGFNVPSADIGVIAASSGSVRQRIQSLGRLLRRKPSGQAARVFVLYVLDTQDEAIYEKADWDRVIGAERNRYFIWHHEADRASWPDALKEVVAPPRRYRPPSWEVDTDSLRPGDPYPGQTHGRDVKVDQMDNLRADDGSVVPVPAAVLSTIVSLNTFGRARVTPAGHVITRADSRAAGDADWRFAGFVEAPITHAEGPRTRLRLVTSGGRRHIALEGSGRRDVPFALGPDNATTPAAGESRDRLLEWIRKEESRLGRPIRDLYWDGAGEYWLELKGERIRHPETLEPLEFRK